MYINKIFKKRASNNRDSNIENFIPLVAHLNEDTLITKNGELIQNIFINGINANFIPTEIYNLRNVVSNAIKNLENKENLSFFIHVVRQKDDITFNLENPNYFSSKVSQMWSDYNSWSSKHINSLYISIVYKPMVVSTISISSFINSFFSSVISNSHKKYIKSSVARLNQASNFLLSELESLKPEKLKAVFDDFRASSQQIDFFLKVYRTI